MNVPGRPASIETARLRLTPLCPGDAAALHALWSGPAVRQHLWDGRSLSLEQTEQMAARSAALHAERGFGLWAARLPEAPALVGFCGYWHFHSELELELLYAVDPGHWGRGFGTELARALVQYGFESLRFGEIRASTGASNAASARILRRLGFLQQRPARHAPGEPLRFILPRGVWAGASFDEGGPRLA